MSGDLFVSTVGCSSFGVMRISGFASGPGTVTGYSSPGTVDGLTFAPDGTLYAALFGQSIVRIAGTNASTPGAFTLVANVPSSDGTAVAASSDPSRPLAIFANRNDGIITRIDLTTNPPTLSTVASGGTRGDFVAVGPDGCLYATQTSTIVRVTNADGTCSLTPTGAQPQLSLSPSVVSPSPTVGTSTTFDATVRNVAGHRPDLSVRRKGSQDRGDGRARQYDELRLQRAPIKLLSELMRSAPSPNLRTIGYAISSARQTPRATPPATVTTRTTTWSGSPCRAGPSSRTATTRSAT